MLKTGPRTVALVMLLALSQSGCNTMLQRLPALVFISSQTSSGKDPGAPSVPPVATDTRQPLQLAAVKPPAAVPVPTSAVPDATERDLWQRLRKDFQLPSDERDAVTGYRDWFQKHPRHLQRVMTRAKPFLHLVVEAVQERDMPAELALLPAVESGFQPFAYSEGRAAGIWQFIPGTGRRFGLRQDWWYDGRRDIVESTRAALDYLDDLHQRFDDWLLAIAAYNCGEGNVIKAIASNRRDNRPLDFWSLDLPRETRAYVPQLLALARIVDTPAEYGITLPPIENQAVVRLVDTQGPIDLAKAAELAGISIEELYNLNPAFNRWASAPEGPHRLLLPLAEADRFDQRLGSLPAEQRMHWARHKIRKGESLSVIAKHYGTSLEVLKTVNHLDGDRIRAGRHLLVPKAVRSLDNYTLSQDMRQAAESSAAARGAQIKHQVRPGESLWSIARKYGVTVAQLSSWNGISSRDTLAEGRSLAVRTGSQAEPAATRRRITYTVRSGESLWEISQRFRVSIASLRRWNDLQNQRYLQPGQKLLVYVDLTRQSSAAEQDIHGTG